MSLTREWFSAAELAELKLPTLPQTKQGVLAQAEREAWADPDREGQHWRVRAGRGGGVEYNYRVLPLVAQAHLVLRFAGAADAPARRRPNAPLASAEMWAWFDRQPEKRKAVARQRLEALDAVEALVLAGRSRSFATETVAHLKKIGVRTLYEWISAVEVIDRPDWLPHLAPRYAGGVAEATLSDEAWEVLKADYLRPEKPAAADCVRRLRQIGAERGWTLPSDRTLFRRLSKLDVATVTLRREGEHALKRMIPAQQRDRSALHALEVVNADGHKWDVFVRWPDGTIGRPMMTAFQDIYSGMVLSWRVDVSENWHAVRLAFGDLVERFGIPDHCLFDNGRHYASKKITGGAANRYRFKVRDEDPQGLLTALGVQVHWATPYAGQSKPIERAFRDMATGGAKHPRFAGAYTGNNPTAKPENYGKTAVPLDVFLETAAEIIAEHNSRAGRTGGITRGRSFAQTFDESYARAVIRKATADQRRLWLMAADTVSVRSQDGTIEFMGNRYWSELLWPLRGRKVTVRFDPLLLQEPLHVYRQDGAYLGAAACQEAAGFLSVEAAQAHARKRRTLMKALKVAAAAEASMTIDQVAEMLPKIAQPEAPPAPKAVRLFQGSAALKPIADHDEHEDRQAAQDRRLVEALRAHHGPAHLRVVSDDD